LNWVQADVAQLAERVLGKDEVTSSILVIGSILRSRMQAKDAHHSTRSERRWAAVARRELRMASHVAEQSARADRKA
jgi:hypothetical protein